MGVPSVKQISGGEASYAINIRDPDTSLTSLKPTTTNPLAHLHIFLQKKIKHEKKACSNISGFAVQ
jgi:hypothetical protein